jgi:signal peptide peptidase SppA
MVGPIAVIAVEGPLVHKAGWWLDYESLAATFRSCLDDSSVSAVVLKFDSPGGEVSGLNETVAIMQAAKNKAGKPVYGYVDESCYSAAYALACVCDELYLPESASVGSIGVITAMCDVTKNDEANGIRVAVVASGSKKTDGHPHVALTDDAIARTQATVDRLASAFFVMVSDARGLKTSDVEAYQAGTFMGTEAVDAGLADGVMSLSELLTLAQSVQASKVPNPNMVNNMAGLLAAQKGVNDAQAALGSAKGDAERALAAARVVSAEKELAKVRKMKTTDKTIHTEEVDDGEEDSSVAETSTGADDEEGEDAEDGEDEKKAIHPGDDAKTGLHTKGRLLRLARQITGKTSIEDVMGALHATWAAQRDHAKLAKEVASLKAAAESAKVEALVASGIKAGKIAPSQCDWAKSQTVSGLKAYLDAAPKLVATAGDEQTEAPMGSSPVGSVTPEMAKIWAKQGFTEKDYPALVAKLNANAPKGAY